jgi:hypothetical protein
MAILIDTNAYLRLAKNFSPLLGQGFVIPPEALQVLSEVDTEISASPRLESKFSWALDAEHTKNRNQNLVSPNGKQLTDIFAAKSVVNGTSDNYRISGDYKKRGLTPPSPTDCLVLTYAYVLNLQLAADDGGMKFLAGQFHINCMGSHELLKLMLDSKTITIQQIQSLARYLDYIKDIPASWKRDAKALFGISLP